MTEESMWEQPADAERQTIVAEPKEVHVEAHGFKVTTNGPVMLDGKEIRRVTGLRLKWSVDDPVWRLELDQVLLP